MLELNEAAQRLRTLADGVCVRAASALDTSGAWAPEGAKSPAAWLQWRCRIQRGRAVTFLRCARELRTMPATEVALLAGQITVEHVRLLVDAKQLSPEAFTADEDRLVGAAARLRVAQFEKALAYWKHLHEPDLTEQTAQEAFEARSCPPRGRWTTSWSWTRCSIRSAAPSSYASSSAWNRRSGKPTGPTPGPGG